MKLFFGILVAGALFLFGMSLIGGCPGSGKQAAAVQRAGADFHAIGSALNAYKGRAGSFPTTEQGLKAMVEAPMTPPLPADWVQIMRKSPLDPWQNEYQYRRLPGDDPRGFELRSLGKDGVPSDDDLSSLDE